jgi:hypothetical protein
MDLINYITCSFIQLDYLSDDFSAFLDGNSLGSLSTLASHLFNRVHNVQSCCHFAKDNVLSIEPRGVSGADEELAAVGIGTRVGHAQDSLALVFEYKVLVGELLAVDGFSTSSVVVGKVATDNSESSIQVCE